MFLVGFNIRLNLNDFCLFWMIKEVIEFRNVLEVGGEGWVEFFSLGCISYKIK